MAASVKETSRDFHRDEFRSLAARFYGTSIRVRQEVAEEMAQVAAGLELDDVLEFARSRDPGERVAAAIALGVHMRSSPQAREDPRVLGVVHALLHDPRERVRYRCAEVLQSLPELVPEFEDDLTTLAEVEANADVRQVARQALARGRR